MSLLKLPPSLISTYLGIRGESWAVSGAFYSEQAKVTAIVFSDYKISSFQGPGLRQQHSPPHTPELTWAFTCHSSVKTGGAAAWPWSWGEGGNPAQTGSAKWVLSKRQLTVCGQCPPQSKVSGDGIGKHDSARCSLSLQRALSLVPSPFIDKTLAGAPRF